MDFRIFTEPQNGANYGDQLALARAAEAAGFDGYFRSDHYLAMDDRHGGLPGPTDAWVTLAGLARETSTIRLGTLVSPATFRLPGILAIQVAQVDDMSGGRIELGLGTGWFADEHEAYGIPFPTKRFGMLEEQLAVITGLWNTPLGDRFSFAGEHYALKDSPALPKPVQSPVPIIVGGSGPSRTPAIAARFAAEYNSWVSQDADVTERVDRVRAACEAIGRDPHTMVFSIAATTAAGPSRQVVDRRADAANTTAEDLRRTGFAGSAAEIADRICALADVGISRIYFQVHDFSDLDHVDFIAREVLPRVG